MHSAFRFHMRGIAAAFAVAATAGLAACGGDAGPAGPTAPSLSNANSLPTYAAFKAALIDVQKEKNGGLGFDMWGTIVNREGVVQMIAFTGASVGDQWPGSRVISAQKANTANAFSLPGFALSTANLYAATQPGGTLFGLQESNPVNDEIAYAGSTAKFGSVVDPLVGKKIGGINVFGGGLALYARDGTLLGALGVSGDASCADHIIAWKLRDKLGLDNVPGGVAPGAEKGTDNIIYDIVNGVSASGFGHPECGKAMTDISNNLPKTNPIGG